MPSERGAAVADKAGKKEDVDAEHQEKQRMFVNQEGYRIRLGASTEYRRSQSSNTALVFYRGCRAVESVVVVVVKSWGALEMTLVTRRKQLLWPIGTPESAGNTKNVNLPVAVVLRVMETRRRGSSFHITSKAGLLHEEACREAARRMPG